jgi:GT2 family glycosyltransferase
VNKDLSIIIVNYHTFDLTRKCIQSILDKTTALEFEIILVDNGSTGTESEAFVKLFPELRYLKLSSNVGFAKANNLGIKKAAGEYILLLNSDTELVNNACLEGVRIMKANEHVGVLSGQLLNPDGTLQAVAGVFPSIKREIKELFRLTRFYKGEKRAIYYLWDQWDYNRPLEVDWVWGAFFMFRKKEVEQFPDGKLHDNFFMYYEDVQWCYYFKKVLKKKVLFSRCPRRSTTLARAIRPHQEILKGIFTAFCPTNMRGCL